MIQDLTQIRDTLVELQRAIDALDTKRVDELKAKLKELGAENATLVNGVLDLGTAVGDLEEAITDENNAITKNKEYTDAERRSHDEVADAVRKHAEVTKELKKAKEEEAKATSALEKESKSTIAQAKESTTALKSLKTEFREAKEEVQRLTLAYNDLSDEEKRSPIGRDLANQLDEASKRAGRLKDAMSDASVQIKNMASDTAQLDALQRKITAIQGGIGAGVGILGMFGFDNTAVDQALAKIAQLMIAVRGLKDVQSMFQHQNTASATAVGVNTTAIVANTHATDAHATSAKQDAGAVGVNATAIDNETKALVSNIAVKTGNVEATKKALEEANALRGILDGTKPAVARIGELTAKTVVLESAITQLQHTGTIAGETLEHAGMSLDEYFKSAIQGVKDAGGDLNTILTENRRAELEGILSANEMTASLEALSVAEATAGEGAEVATVKTNIFSKTLKGCATSAKALWAQLNAMLGSVGAMALGVGALVAGTIGLAVGFNKLVNHLKTEANPTLKRSAKEMELLDKATEGAIDKATDQLTALRKTIDVLKHAKKGTDAYKEAEKQLVDTADRFNVSLKKKKDGVYDLSHAYDNLTQSIINSAMAEATMELTKEDVKSMAEARLESKKARRKFDDDMHAKGYKRQVKKDKDGGTVVTYTNSKGDTQWIKHDKNGFVTATSEDGVVSGNPAYMGSQYGYTSVSGTSIFGEKDRGRARDYAEAEKNANDSASLASSMMTYSNKTTVTTSPTKGGGGGGKESRELPFNPFEEYKAVKFTNVVKENYLKYIGKDKDTIALEAKIYDEAVEEEIETLQNTLNGNRANFNKFLSENSETYNSLLGKKNLDDTDKRWLEDYEQSVQKFDEVSAQLNNSIEKARQNIKDNSIARALADEVADPMLESVVKYYKEAGLDISKPADQQEEVSRKEGEITVHSRNEAMLEAQKSALKKSLENEAINAQEKEALRRKLLEVEKSIADEEDALRTAQIERQNIIDELNKKQAEAEIQRAKAVADAKVKAVQSTIDAVGSLTSAYVKNEKAQRAINIALGTMNAGMAIVAGMRGIAEEHLSIDQSLASGAYGVGPQAIAIAKGLKTASTVSHVAEMTAQVASIISASKGSTSIGNVNSTPTSTAVANSNTQLSVWNTRADQNTTRIADTLVKNGAQQPVLILQDLTEAQKISNSVTVKAQL